MIICVFAEHTVSIALNTIRLFSVGYRRELGILFRTVSDIGGSVFPSAFPGSSGMSPMIQFSISLHIFCMKQSKLKIGIHIG